MGLDHISMRRREVLKKVRDAAQAASLPFEVTELTNHTGVTVGSHRSTIGRHSEVDNTTARKFFKQFEEVFGEGWWK